MIPKEITREHLLAAIATIDRGGYGDRFESTRFDLIHRGKRYPPKQVVRIAARLITEDEIDFSGGIETNSFLEKHGFQILSKDSVTRAFLLTWNPKKWAWDDRSEAIAQVETTGMYFDRWSVGNRTDLPRGSRVYLMRLGEHPKGLVGCGWSISSPHRTPHWATSRAASGEQALYVGVEFDVLVEEPILTLDDLGRPPFDVVPSWTPQSSGLELPSEVAQELEATIGRMNPRSATDATQMRLHSEGAKRQFITTSYERNSRARRDCIAHYGASCIICGFDFGKTYGHQFEGHIHVHHLQQVSDIGESYLVDPVKDLRPVCPNCHAALHLGRSTPYTIEELKMLMTADGKNYNTR